MKKLFVVLGIAVGMHFAHAQKSLNEEFPIRLFNEGKEMFMDKNYVGCLNSLYEFKNVSKDEKLNMEADYMILSSLFFRGTEDIEIPLKEFLEIYPETYHRNQICFYIGTSHFEKKEWEKALFWFNQSDVDYLDKKDQEDYSFRLAYASLQRKDRQKAYQLFGLLKTHSDKYAEPAGYYLAYIDFQNGEYDSALKTFEQLKNKSEYREQSLFFLTQGSFIKGNTEKSIAEGEDYIRNYPNSNNAKEIYRILGNSYNQTGDINNSITYYEKYMQKESNPIAEDMYLLGKSYYQVGAYQDAIRVLKYAASTQDKLGQAAYMELGLSYLKVNDSRNALMAFEAASRVQFDPATSEAALYNYALLVHQTSLSVFDESVTVLQRFLKEYPNSKYANQINDILASTFLSTKNYKAALTAINEIQSPGRQILEAKQAILFRLGTQDFINGDYRSASSYFDSCISMGNYDTKSRNEAYFWKGEIDFRENKFQESAKNYQTYISQANGSDANYGLGLYNLGYSYFKMKQYNQALSNFQKYVNQESDKKSLTYADALNRIGDCYLYNRNYSNAEKFYAQAATSMPSGADYAEFQKAFVRGLQRNYSGKINTLDNMMSKYPNSPYYDNALFEKSRALVMQNKDGEAIQVLERLLREYPNSSVNQQAGVQLGQLYFNTNNHQKSIEAYKRVIKNYPNSEEARMSLKSLESVYKEINDINSYVSFANSLGGGMSITPTRQDSLVYLAAENVFMKGDRGAAKNSMQQYLQSYPNGIFSSDAHFYLGFIAFENNDKNTALSEFNYVIDSNNRKYIDDALIYASGIEYDKQNYQEAYNYYSKLNEVTNSGENKSTAQLGMLRSASLMNKNTEVIQAATSLINNEKTSPEIVTEARYYRAKAFQAEKETDSAIEDYQLLAKDSRNVFGAEAQFILAETYYKWGSYDRAISQVQDFIGQGSPHNYWLAKSLIVLSDSYAAKGDEFEAKQYLESLKANYNGSETDILEAINERLNK